MEKNIDACKNESGDISRNSEVKLSLDEMVRKYINEWDNEIDHGERFFNNPEGEISFSWFWHEKELISIQKAIRRLYMQVANQIHTSLNKEEMEKIDKILSCVID